MGTIKIFLKSQSTYSPPLKAARLSLVLIKHTTHDGKKDKEMRDFMNFIISFLYLDQDMHRKSLSGNWSSLCQWAPNRTRNLKLLPPTLFVGRVFGLAFFLFSLPLKMEESKNNLYPSKMVPRTNCSLISLFCFWAISLS